MGQLASIPLQLTGCGVDSDNMGEKYHIYFLSHYSSQKLYLGDNCLVRDLDKAISNTDIREVISKMTELLKDKEFLNYMEQEFCF